MGDLPDWWAIVHCGGLDGQPVRLIRTRRGVAPVGFPSECPNGHLLGPRRMLAGTQGCLKVDDRAHPTVTCEACSWIWIDLVCTVGPGWQSRETWHQRFVPLTRRKPPRTSSGEPVRGSEP